MTKINKSRFTKYILPYLSVGKRGPQPSISYYKIVKHIVRKLQLGCQWSCLPLDYQDSRKLTWQAIYYYFRKWSLDGSLQKALDAIRSLTKSHLDLSELHLDGSHTPAKKGGEKVNYQGRKKCKTTNLVVLTDKKGIPIHCVSIESGNHNDSYNIVETMRETIKTLKAQGLPIEGATLNADAGFDTIKLRKLLFNHNITPNIKENPRNRKNKKRGRKRLFNPLNYKNRIAIERLFSRLDSLRTLLVRHERKEAHWASFHCIAFLLLHLETLN